MNRKQQAKLVREHYHATRAGWLLACSAPDNIAKGEKIFAQLPPAEQAVAKQYRDLCLQSYE